MSYLEGCLLRLGRPKVDPLTNPSPLLPIPISLSLSELPCVICTLLGQVLHPCVLAFGLAATSLIFMMCGANLGQIVTRLPCPARPALLCPS
jgi:hypothetical protein